MVTGLQSVKIQTGRDFVAGVIGAIPVHFLCPGRLLFVNQCAHFLSEQVEDSQIDFAGARQLIFDDRIRVEGIGMILMKYERVWQLIGLLVVRDIGGFAGNIGQRLPQSIDSGGSVKGGQGDVKPDISVVFAKISPRHRLAFLRRDTFLLLFLQSVNQIASQRITRAQDQPIAQAGIGRKFQKPTVFEQHSVWDNLDLALKDDRRWFRALSARTGRAAQRRIEELLATIGLEDATRRPAGLLAHGQKQRLEIGMLLAQDPRLLLLDEPVAGMTDEETERLAARGLLRGRGAADLGCGQGSVPVRADAGESATERGDAWRPLVV